jgi:hypothetical protein
MDDMPEVPDTEHYTRWAWDIIDSVPFDMQPSYANNLCRVLGYLPGVTKVYAYLGGGIHFFDLHFEEMGIAAVNIRIRFHVHDGKVAKISFPEISDPLPDGSKTPEEVLFYQLVQEGKNAIWSLIHSQEFENVPKHTRGRVKSEVRLPYEFIRLFNATGFKDWYTFMGSEQELLSLNKHILDVAGYKSRDTVGISVLQHHEKPRHRKNGLLATNVHITLDFSTIPARFSDMFQRTTQYGGQIVYTHNKLHVGEGVCTFNSAYNVYQAALHKVFARPDRGIDECSPLTFNHRMALLARQDRGTDTAGMMAGKFDSLSCALARSVFCADTLDVANKLCDGVKDRIEAFHDYRLEVNHYRSEHQQVDGQLHRKFGDRIFGPYCVPDRKKRVNEQSSYKQLSSARAYEMHLVFYLCTGCGVVMLLNKCYTPTSNYAPDAVQLPVINLCPYCASECCEKDINLKLVEVPRMYIETVGFKDIEKGRVEGDWWT